MDDNSNDNPLTKKTVRKKLVDLKAVAALLENNDDTSPPSRSLYIPHEDLIQETARIKTQRDLILQRVGRMEQNRNRVSKNVFDKVYRDYSMQQNAISDLLNEKKELLNKELKNLYSIREKQNVEMNRHKEILEEAQFRHFLAEFTEEQYKEVEEYESKEISHLQNELARIHTFIKIHEELFDPQDLGLAPRKSPESTPLSAPSAKPPSSPEPHSVEPTRTSVALPKREQTPVMSPADLSEKTPLPPSASVQTVIRPPTPSSEDLDFESLLEPSESDYFQPEPGKRPEGVRTEASESALSHTDPSLTVKTSSNPNSPNVNSSDSKKSDSIASILKDIPPYNPSMYSTHGDIKVNTPPPTDSSLTPKPTPLQAGETYKLVFLEGTPENMSEFILGENVSIGRSPSNDVVFPAPKVSRQHAAINKYKDHYILIDLKSSNGVFVNGKKVDEHTLEEGDEISISGFRMTFKKT